MRCSQPAGRGVLPRSVYENHYLSFLLALSPAAADLDLVR